MSRYDRNGFPDQVCVILIYLRAKLNYQSTSLKKSSRVGPSGGGHEESAQIVMAVGEGGREKSAFPERRRLRTPNHDSSSRE